jgi:prephenate dehydrogenase
MSQLKRVAIVGLGLIGGSIALELKASGFAEEVIGVDDNAQHVLQALELKLIDRALSLKEACTTADLTVLAVPVNFISKLLPEVLNLIPAHGSVTDVGSTKSEMVRSVESHAKRKRYVPSHPMAGTEFSGPTAAHLGLFQGKAAVICDQTASDPESVRVVEELYQTLKMRLIFMESKEHDLHAAYVSHLSHISSFVLANTVLAKEKNVDAIFNLASGGFESTVRLAKSSPEMWTPIFEQNQTYITEALGEYIDRLKLFHENLKSKNFNQTKKDMQSANAIKRVLTQIGEKHGKKA